MLRWRIYSNKERTISVILLAVVLMTDCWMVWDCFSHDRSVFGIAMMGIVLFCSVMSAYRSTVILLEPRGSGYGALEVSESGELLTCAAMPLRRDVARPVKIEVKAGEGSYTLPPYDDWIQLKDGAGKMWRIKYGDSASSFRKEIVDAMNQWKGTRG